MPINNRIRVKAITESSKMVKLLKAYYSHSTKTEIQNLRQKSQVENVVTKFSDDSMIRLFDERNDFEKKKPNSRVESMIVVGRRCKADSY